MLERQGINIEEGLFSIDIYVENMQMDLKNNLINEFNKTSLQVQYTKIHCISLY